MTPVFVTGATGMLGGALVRRLAEEGNAVRALVRPGTDASALSHPAVEVVRGDLSDPEALAAVMQGARRAFHVAALVSYRRAHAERMYQSNVAGTQNVLWAARETGVERVVHTSSTAAVGLSERPQPLDEDASFEPRFRAVPYMWTKHLAEVEVAQAVAAGQDVVMVNPSTILGPGDVHMNSGKVFRRIARGALGSAPPGGNSVVALDDVVDGHLQAMEQGVAGRRYILNEENLPHVALLSRIAHALGRPPVTRVLPRWSERPLRLAASLAELAGGALTPQVIWFSFRFRYFSADRAARELAWRPRAGVDAAIAAAAAWYRGRGLL